MRWSENRIHRRTVLRAGGAAGALAGLSVAGVGCGPAGDQGDAAPTSATSAAPEQPVAGGTLNLHTTIDPVNFDFQASLFTPVVFTLYGNRLVRFKTGPGISPNDYEITGDLATSWETPDPTTVTFNLDSAVAFHNIDPVNGRALTSTDVKETLNHLAISDGTHLFSYLANYIERIDTTDPHTAVLKLKTPTPLVFQKLAFYNAAIAPAEIYARDGNLEKNTIGTGPFQAGRLEKGVAYEFRKNPAYFRKDQPYLDGVTLSVLPDANAALDALRSGRLDAIDVPFESLQNAQQTLPKDSTTLTTVPGIGWFAPWFNTTKPPFNDLRVRRAFSYALDRNAINNLVARGKAGVRTGPISRGWQWSRSEEAIQQSARRDVAKAKQLLDAAGHGDGLDVEFIGIAPWLTGAYGNLVQVIQEQLKEAGIKISIQLSDQSAVVARLARQDYTLAHWSIRAYPDADDYLAPFFLPGGSKNFGATNDSALSDLIINSEQATDTEARKAILQEIDTRWVDDFAYSCYTIELPFSHAHRNTLGNYAPRNPTDYANLEGAFKKA